MKGRQMAKESFSMTLPGRIYQKKNRWWWTVQLPGEQRVKARALKLPGTRFATTDRQEAQQIALEMWQLAIRAEIEKAVGVEVEQKLKSYTEEMAQVQAEATETIAKLKAQFAEQIQAYSDAVARAEEKAKAEATARAEAEAKLNEILAQRPSTATCECCGKEDVPESDMVRIDSGQLLCPDCLRQLRG
jgi:transketolase